MAIDPAWIGFAGGVIGTAASAVIAVRQRRGSDALARLNSDLAAQRDERKVRLDRDQRAEVRAEEQAVALTRYRVPLAAAAYDLQSRCYNIVALDFLATFGDMHERASVARSSTTFRFAQYFGWAEFLRRDILFLSFPTDEDTRRVVELQAQIMRRLATSDNDEPLMIWADEQRAIGERMIVEEHGTVLCMGYARFCAEYDERFAVLCDRVFAELAEPGAADRLRDVQHLLCELVEALDRERVRYAARDLQRA